MRWIKGCFSLHAASLVVRMVVSYWLEVWVQHGLLGSDALCMVIPEHLAEEVQCLIRHKLIVLRVDEFGPGLVRNWVLR